MSNDVLLQAKFYICRKSTQIRSYGELECSKRPMKGSEVTAWIDWDRTHSGYYMHTAEYRLLSRDYGKLIRSMLWLVNITPGIPTYRFNLKSKK